MEFHDPCAIVPLPQDASAAFSAVAGEAALAHVVRSLLGAVAEELIVVATAVELAGRARDCLRSAGLGAVAVSVTRESDSRLSAVREGLEYLGLEANSPNPILVGDHRYPLSTGAVAGRVIVRLRAGHDVVVPVLRVIDTVKAVDHLGFVLRTVDRATLRNVQYPRGFSAAVLWKLLSDMDSSSASDEFIIALRAGLAITTVDGDQNAFQVELPRDSRLLNAIIACRPH